jgi:hypothetical protein
MKSIKFRNTKWNIQSTANSAQVLLTVNCAEIIKLLIRYDLYAYRRAFPLTKTEVTDVLYIAHFIL